MFVSSTRWIFLLLILIAGNVLADTNYNPFLNTQEPKVCSARTTRHFISLDQRAALIRFEDLIPGVDYHLFVSPARPDKQCVPVARMIQSGNPLTLMEPGIYLFKSTGTSSEIMINGPSCSPDQTISLSIGKTKDQPKTLSSISQGIEISLDTYSVEELIETVFIGGDCFQVEPGSIRYEGDEESVGFFSSGTDALSMEEGIILSTGKVERAIGPNEKYNTGSWMSGTSDDPDLQQLLADDYNLRDRASLEFDFTPTSEMISFEFVFASEEYCEYVDSDFNDVFGFFISGPGINGPFSDNGENIAFVPGSNDYISINSINHFQNQLYFNNNIPISQHESLPFNLSCPQLEDDPGVASSFLEYDGFTNVMTAMAEVIPCETYHIRLVISDVQDAYFDSAVFLKANSFSGGNTAQISVDVPGFGGDELTEDCNEGYFRFDRTTEDLSEDVVIRYTVSELSTATPGIDYETLPDSIIIPAGAAFFNLPILAYNDDLIEGTENILLEMEIPCSCENPYSVIYLKDGEPLVTEDTEILFCEGQSGLLSANVSGGIGTVSYLWNTGDTLAELSVIPAQNTEYTVTITDQCGKTVSAVHRVMVTPEPTATLSGASFLCENITDNTLPVTLTGSGPWNLEYTLNGVPQNPIVGILNNNFALPVTTSGTYMLTAVNSSNCVGTPAGSGIVEAINLQINEVMEPLTCPGAADGGLAVTANGGTMPYDFSWENGIVGSENNGLDSGFYQVTLTDNNGCEAVRNLSVTLDPEAPTVAIATAGILTCDATEITLSASASDGPVYQYIWETANGNIQSGNGSLNPVVTEPGEYILAVINTSSGCRQTDTLTVVEDVMPPDPVVFVQGPQTLTCNETSTILDATASRPFGEVTFTWSTEDGYLDPANINHPIPEIDSAGLYQLLLTNTVNGCTSSLNTLISLNVTAPDPVIIAPAELTCLDTVQRLDATASTTQGIPGYLWTTTDGNIRNGSTGLTPEIDVPGTYQLEILDTENGCTAQQTVTVTENVTPPVSEIVAPAEALDCNTFTLELDSGNSSQGDDFTFKWNTDIGIIAGSSSGVSASVTAPGEYHLIVTDQRNGCTASASTTVQQNLVAPVANITVQGSDILNCEFPATIISGATSTGENPLAYRWSSTDGVLAVEQLTQMENEILSPGVYELEVMDVVNACTDQTEVMIAEDKILPVVMIVSPPELNCYKDTISVSADGSDQGVSYTAVWSSLDGNITGGVNDLNIEVDQSGTYQLRILNTENGCSNTGTVVVNENRVPPVAMISPVTEMLDCNTPEITLSAVGNLSDDYVFAWRTDNGNILGNTGLSNIAVNAAGRYELEVTDTGNGCQAETTELVEVNENRPEDITLEIETPNCYGETGSLSILSVTGGEGPYLFALDLFPDEIFYPDTSYQNLEPGAFSVTVLDVNGCTYTESVTMAGVPELVVTTEPRYEINLGESQELNAVVNVPDFRIDSIVWQSQNENLCVNCYDPVVQPLEDTYYTVSVIDEDGCMASAQTLVAVDKKRRVYIPNAFSPNGDGQNERLTVFTDLTSVKQVNTLQIFSRWGEKLFENNDFQPNQETEGWNGLFGTKKMMSGVYVYFAEVEFIDGHRELYKGDVTLLR